MGRIARLLSFTRVIRNGANVSDVKIDPGGGANITDEHFAPPGDDSYPLDSDYVATMGIDRAGGEIAVGYVDPLNIPKANKGDKRIYARDPSTGAVMVELWLKNDGTAVVSNDNGSVTLNPDGEVNANDALITTDGDVITSDNISLRNHKHIGNLGSPTGPPLP